MPDGVYEFEDYMGGDSIDLDLVVMKVKARDAHGVAIDTNSWTVDHNETLSLRKSRKKETGNAPSIQVVKVTEAALEKMLKASRAVKV